MNNKKIIELDDNPIFQASRYFRLDAASKLLGCLPEDLLHLGAIGKVEIIAPAFANKVCEWPVGSDGRIDSDEPPFRTSFSLSDRIILAAVDVAILEAARRVTPKFFFAPDKARELIRNWDGFSFSESHLYYDLSRNSDGGLSYDDMARLKHYEPHDSTDWLLKEEDAFQTEFERSGEENAITVPWYYSDLKAEDLISIDHLFIEKEELVRLSSGDAQDIGAIKRIQFSEAPRKTHKNAERFSSARESVLRAAIYCKNKWPENCKNKNGVEQNTVWAELIDSKAPLFWPEGKPPLNKRQIEDLLSDALKYGDKNS